MNRFDDREINAVTKIGLEELDAIKEVFTDGDLSPFYRSYLGGGKVQELEKLFAVYHGAKHAISVSSGTAALHCVYLSLGLKRGSEVITTPYTFVATASMLVVSGYKPVFVDVNPLTYNIDPNKIVEAITSKTKAIVPVHLLGHPAEMKTILEIAEDHNLLVIEDAAQALSAEYYNKKVGSMGVASIFSGQWTKNCSFGGEGGIILTDNDEIAKRCQAYRNHGEKYAIPRTNFIGFNYRLTEIAAAIGIEQFKKLSLFIDVQKKNAEYLMKHLPKGIKPPYVAPNVYHPFWILGCQYDKDEANMSRDNFIEILTKMGLNKKQPGATVSNGYSELVYQLPALKRYERTCVVAESLLKTSLWLDLHRFPSSKDKMQSIIETMNDVLKYAPRLNS